MPFGIFIDDQLREIEIIRRRPNLIVRIDGREHEIELDARPDKSAQSVRIDGRDVKYIRAIARDHQVVRVGTRNFLVRATDSTSTADSGATGQDAVKSPMPGVVVSVSKSVGDTVKRGETVVTIESMKLQTALVAPRDGVIAELLCKQGDKFEKGEIIARLEPQSSGA